MKDIYIYLSTIAALKLVLSCLSLLFPIVYEIYTSKLLFFLLNCVKLCVFEPLEGPELMKRLVYTLIKHFIVKIRQDLFAKESL